MILIPANTPLSFRRLLLTGLVALFVSCCAGNAVGAESAKRGEGNRSAAKDEAKEKVAEVKLADLLAAPAKYHGMLVEVSGYRRNGAVTDDLYLSKVKADAQVRAASVQIAGFKEPEKAVFSLAEYEAVSNTVVRVQGVFYADDFFPEQKGYLTQLRWIRRVEK